MLAPLLLAAAASTPFDQVVAAERAFASEAPAKGLHAAFLGHLAPDAVVFDPAPVSGVAAHEGKTEDGGTLSWGPAWVAAPAAGDIAFSSGPWEFRRRGDGAPPAVTGWFFSVWRRQPDGAWKVGADIGVPCPLAYEAPAEAVDGLAGRSAGVALDRGRAAQARARLAAEEARLDAAAKSGVGAAVLARADEEIRVYRKGTCPVAGLRAARPLLQADARALSCEPARIELDATGRLGYAYGSCRGASGGATGYLRVWRGGPEGGYKVLADVVLELPGSK